MAGETVEKPSSLPEGNRGTDQLRVPEDVVEQQRFSTLQRARDGVMRKIAKTKVGRAIGNSLLEQFSKAGRGLLEKRAEKSSMTTSNPQGRKEEDEEEERKRKNQSQEIQAPPTLK